MVPDFSGSTTDLRPSAPAALCSGYVDLALVTGGAQPALCSI